jgi:hypothetical protein
MLHSALCPHEVDRLTRTADSLWLAVQPSNLSNLYRGEAGRTGVGQGLDGGWTGVGHPQCSSTKAQLEVPQFHAISARHFPQRPSPPSAAASLPQATILDLAAWRAAYTPLLRMDCPHAGADPTHEFAPAPLAPPTQPTSAACGDGAYDSYGARRRAHLLPRRAQLGRRMGGLARPVAGHPRGQATHPLQIWPSPHKSTGGKTRAADPRCSIMRMRLLP